MASPRTASNSLRPTKHHRCLLRSIKYLASAARSHSHIHHSDVVLDLGLGLHEIDSGSVDGFTDASGKSEIDHVSSFGPPQGLDNTNRLCKMIVRWMVMVIRTIVLGI